jgi:hypothetical protein
MKIETKNGFSENGQFGGAVNVTSSQAALPFVAGGLHVGTVGDLTLIGIDGSQFTLTNVSGFIPAIVTHFLTGSTATNVVALK